MAIAITDARSAHNRTLILLTMSLGVLIAQVDTSVVNLAIKQIGSKPSRRCQRAAVGR